MLWGGLRPIPSRLALDVLALASFFYCAATPPARIGNSAVLTVACLVMIATAGPACRWTITFPMAPFLLLQGLRRVECVVGWSPWVGTAIGALSIAILLVSAALSILFPVVELSPVRGRYNVGVVDLHLPADFTEGLRRGSLLGTQHQDGADGSAAYVSARLLYPTDDEPERRGVPYLDPESAALVCDQMMKAGAPGPLKRFGWMLYSYRFVRVRKARRNAQPAPSAGGFPIAVYSHGLSGNSPIYSYQAMSVASRGTVVLMVDHTDRSAIAVRRRDSSHMLYESCSLVSELRTKQINEEEYDRKRRKQTDHRVEECLSALKALKRLNRTNIPDLESVGISFVDKLDLSYTTVMGHSFGGGTVLSLAARRPDMVNAVVAHEPATGWMPDDAKEALFATEEVSGKEEEKKDSSSPGSSREEVKTIHDVNMLFLYSDEWAAKGWGGYKLVKALSDGQRLGPKDGTSEVGVIKEARHSEFSDICMLTPTWLARSTGLTGKRNPHDTAEEIACRTATFLEATRKAGA